MALILLTFNLVQRKIYTSELVTSLNLSREEYTPMLVKCSIWHILSDEFIGEKAPSVQTFVCDSLQSFKALK